MTFEVVTPEGWTQSKIGRYCAVQLGKMLQSEPSSENDVLRRYLRAINISKDGLNLSHNYEMWIKQHELQKYRLCNGDVLVSEGGDAGRTTQYFSDEEMYFQNAINRIRPQDVDVVEPRFIHYWFTFLKLAGYVDMTCNVATLAHFTAEKVSAAPFHFPAIEIQKNIARHLDEKTEQIDGLIEKKRALLDRLVEKRQALITHAVTKGLNPNAPMKDSGIEWLGEVPEHWEMHRLKEVCADIIDCKNRTPPLVEDGDFFVIRTSCLGNGGFDPSGGYYTDLDSFEEWTKKGTPKTGDVLISREAPIGEACLFPEGYKLCLGQRMMLARPDFSKLNSNFLLFVIYSGIGREYVDLRKKGTTVGHLRVPEVFNFPVLLPSIPEQEAIVEFLENYFGKASKIEREISKSIGALIEYRSALISSAVTGRIEGLQ